MNRKVVLVKRPVGIPTDSDFAIVNEPLISNLSPGEVLVKIEWTSVDPAQRI